MIRRNSLVVAVATLGMACGSKATPTAPAATAPAVAPAVAAPTAPTAPAAISGCTVAPSISVTRERRRPQVVVSRGHVAIVHEPRRTVSVVDGHCDPPRAVHTSALPISESSFTAMPVQPACADVDGDGTFDDIPNATLFADAARGDADLYAVICEMAEPDSDADPLACWVSRVGANGPSTSVRFRNGYADVETVRGGFQASKVGETTFFGVALANTVDGTGDGVYAILLNGGNARVTPRLGRPPSQIDLDDPKHFTMAATARDGGGFVFDQGAAATTHRVRTMLDANGATVGPPAPTTIEAPAPTAIDFATERVGRAPSVVRLYRAGSPTPIGGFPTDVATFGARFVTIGERVVLVWSEGTGTTTRIRAAVVDPVAGSLVGSIREVSTAGVEAGYATVDAFEGKVVVAWDEKKADGWDVRVAMMECR